MRTQTPTTLGVSMSGAHVFHRYCRGHAERLNGILEDCRRRAGPPVPACARTARAGSFTASALIAALHVQCFQISPINAQTLSFRPLVIPDDTVLRIQVGAPVFPHIGWDSPRVLFSCA